MKKVLFMMAWALIACACGNKEKASNMPPISDEEKTAVVNALLKNWVEESKKDPMGTMTFEINELTAEKAEGDTIVVYYSLFTKAKGFTETVDLVDAKLVKDAEGNYTVIDSGKLLEETD